MNKLEDLKFIKTYRLLIVIFLVFVFLVFLLQAGLNIYVRNSRARIEATLARIFSSEFKVKDISYTLPSTLSLNDISLEDKSFGKANLNFSADKVKLSIPIGNLLSLKTPPVLRCVFYSPKITIKPSVSKETYQLKPINLIFAKTITPEVILKQGNLIFLNAAGIAVLELNFSGLAKIIKGTNLITDGSFSLSNKGALANIFSKEQKSGPSKLRYNLNLDFNQGGVLLKNLELWAGSMHSKFWGDLSQEDFKFNGFTVFDNLINEPSKEKVEANYSFKKWLESLTLIFPKKKSSTVKIIRKKIVTSITPAKASYGSFNIFDFNGVVKFLPQAIKVEKLTFTLKRIPMFFSGELLLKSPLEAKLNLASFVNQKALKRNKNPQAFDFKISGLFDAGFYSGKAALSYPGSLVEGVFNSFQISQTSPKKLSFKQAAIFYKTPQLSTDIEFFDFSSLLELKPGKIEIYNLSSKLYGGSIFANGEIKINSFPWQSDFFSEINNLDTERISFLNDFDAKIKGKLDGSFHYKNHPAFALTGKLKIKAGQISGFPFFNWLADYFSLPSLKNLDFDELSCGVTADNKNIDLRKISFKSRDLKTSGDLNLMEKEFVSGLLRLGFSSRLLKGSSKFRRLLNFLGEKAESLEFAFRLSGSRTALNFKWLNSDFKRRLKNLLPDSMEEDLEQQVEAIMNDVNK